MGIEIERKFLVNGDAFRQMAECSERLRQGYLCREPERTVRVRVRGDRGFLTVKGKNHGLTRTEFEYEIPIEDAEKMLGMCVGRVIDKTRYLVRFEGNLWEVDEFHGDLSPLITAEIELKEENSEFSLPVFVGAEVTGDKRYYNSNL